MGNIRELLYELAYDLDFYIEDEFECRKALYEMAVINECNYSKDNEVIYEREAFWVLKEHISENFI
ncbi:MAG: hypothetical protein ACRCX8_05575 [Sarcina sp.]